MVLSFCVFRINICVCLYMYVHIHRGLNKKLVTDTPGKLLSEGQG